ncbi:nicotinate phosphoribosyltransferase [Mycoplasmopsis canis PG 14]|uniref:nicotinate phosphoribosyltransferase n=1 Tax=Mycoplasmopsis canis TaxID=29555 RepID=A0A449AQ48_9BACT|nr:nicotinate phosphoribosyltransferase [Mycoplasmopsis canis]AMD81347.1 nicotinate phosphoribosyltransferase [Mycoplasmopsis canis PG 14]EIE40508.1 nicotinate phosphoribosyltransferase [Mycoplasmopsis canis PG 14]VEU68678.1 nicotinic acid phosphoribosyltransferase [Mycoplasmopsis canis]
MNKEKYIASYFKKTQTILSNELPNNKIIMQFFQRQDNSLLAGMGEVLSLLEEVTDTSKYIIRYLPDGSKINNLDIVLELEGNYQDFGIWEGMIDGILARSTSIATNAYKCKVAAGDKKVIFMGDRADHYINQEVDGKAVAIGGISLVSTLVQMQKSENNDNVFGSMPHVLIQGFGGDVVAATKAYHKNFPNNKLIALVDYHNNVIRESLKIWEALGDKVWGVRIDTSKNMVDHMFDGEEPQYGVNPEQIFRLRRALDNAGAVNYKIVVSSGFDEKKIKLFQDLEVPVDYYGVGQSIFKLTNSFSADATILNGKPEAKEGRGYRNNLNLITYKK